MTLRYVFTKDTWLIRESAVALDSTTFEVMAASAPNAVLAYDSEKLVGMFGYALKYGALHAKGTRVRVAYRGQGVGAAMWCAAIRKHNVKRAHVLIVSSKAVRMLRNIEAQIPGVRIHASFGTGPNGGMMLSGAAWKRKARIYHLDEINQAAEKAMAHLDDHELASTGVTRESSIAYYDAIASLCAHRVRMLQEEKTP